ncbi:MAG: ATP-binding protein, partial [Candidatus Bathyarchaeia archaeon]
PPLPGAKVTEVDPDIFAKYLGVNPHGLYIGRALNQEKIRVSIDPNRLLSHHVAILGATGSGKSYTCGVLCEELLDLNVPVVVIDPHGEYQSLSDQNNNQNELEKMQLFEVLWQLFDRVPRLCRLEQSPLVYGIPLHFCRLL